MPERPQVTLAREFVNSCSHLGPAQPNTERWWTGPGRSALCVLSRRTCASHPRSHNLSPSKPQPRQRAASWGLFPVFLLACNIPSTILVQPNPFNNTLYNVITAHLALLVCYARRERCLICSIFFVTPFTRYRNFIPKRVGPKAQIQVVVATSHP